MFSFENKVVWVTGSSTGIGRITALEFAKNGADVIVHCNKSIESAKSLVEEIEKIGRKSFLVQGDISKRDQIKKMVAEIAQEFGYLDILVNNVGSLIERARLESLEENLWDKIIDVNLKSVYLVTKEMLPLMKKQGEGKIINLSSIAAKTGGGPGSIAYATSKGGVTTLTYGLAKELKEYNILVNAVSPGVITTPFHDKYTEPEARKLMVDSIPLNREGTPQETAWAILYLASDYANYIAGEIIDVGSVKSSMKTTSK